jgi:hypothetical protein
MLIRKNNEAIKIKSHCQPDKFACVLGNVKIKPIKEAQDAIDAKNLVKKILRNLLNIILPHS